MTMTDEDRAERTKALTAKRVREHRKRRQMWESGRRMRRVETYVEDVRITDKLVALGKVTRQQVENDDHAVNEAIGRLIGDYLESL